MPDLCNVAYHRHCLRLIELVEQLNIWRRTGMGWCVCCVCAAVVIHILIRFKKKI